MVLKESIQTIVRLNIYVTEMFYLMVLVKKLQISKDGDLHDIYFRVIDTNLYYQLTINQTMMALLLLTMVIGGLVLILNIILLVIIMSMVKEMILIYLIRILTQTLIIHSTFSEISILTLC